MATASRSSRTAGSRPARPFRLISLQLQDALETWLVPAVGVAVSAVAAALGVSGVMRQEPALATAIVGALVVVLFIGMRPLAAGAHSSRVRALGALLALAWLAVCYPPFHLRLFRTPPLIADAQLTARGGGVPLRIPAQGNHAVDLVVATHLASAPGGDVALPVHFTLTVAGAEGAPQVVSGTFADTLMTRRLGRRGQAVVHHVHATEMHIVSNPGSGDLTVTNIVVEPQTAEPITLTVFAHPLPPLPVLVLVAAALLAAVVTFDRRGPGHATDGALTLATTAVLGVALIFWTSDAVRPDFYTLIGATIFGGPIGFAVGALMWWLTKRLIARPA